MNVIVRRHDEGSFVSSRGVRILRKMTISLFAHQALGVADKRGTPVRVDLLVLQVQRQRLDWPGSLDGRARRTPATARPLTTCALEWRDVVRTLELQANVVVAQLADPLGRHVDA